jgi:tetratricopeptide (TPR) repeat protein
VRYLLDGDVVRKGDQTAADLQLFDAGEAKQVWSERIEASAAELPDLPNLLVVRSTLATRVAINTAESHRLAQTEISDASPNELVFRAFGAYDATFEGAMRAKALCEKAIAAAPILASALSCKATMIVESLDLRPSLVRDQLAAEADNLTRQAIGLDEYDAFAWKVRGEALRLLHQWDSALEANEKAIRLDPSRQSHLFLRGIYMIWTGRPEAALPLVERSMKISTSNAGADERLACRAYIALGRFKDAVAACERSVVVDEWWSVHLFLAAA